MSWPRQLRERIAARWLATSTLATVALTTIVAAIGRGIVSEDDITVDLLTSWLPRAYAMLGLATSLIGLGVPPARRRMFLLQYLGLSAAVPLTLAAISSGPFRDIGGWHRDPAHAHLGFAYMALAFASAAHLFSGVWSLLARQSDGRVVLALAGAALAVYTIVLPYQPAVRDLVSDEPHYFVYAQSLWLDQDLDLADDYVQWPYMDFWPEPLADRHAIDTGHGVYHIREPGFPLLIVVPFGLDGRYGVLRLFTVIATLLVAQLFLLLRDLNLGRALALATTGLVAFTHPILSYTTQAFPDLGVALVLVTAARLLRRGGDTRVADLVLASAVAGLLPWLTSRHLLSAAGVVTCAVYWALRSSHRSTAIGTTAMRVAAAIVPFIASLGLLCILTYTMFGDWLPGAGARQLYVSKPFVLAATWTPQIGGTGLLLDRVFGLFANAPLYLLGLVGVIAMLRRAREPGGAAGIVLIAAFLPYFAVMSNFYYWHADWSPPPRYLVGVIALFVAALGCGLDAVRRSAWPILGPLAAVLSAWSVLIAYIFVAHPSALYNWGTREEIHAWSPGALGIFFEHVLSIDPQSIFPSLWWTDAWTIPLTLAWLGAALVLLSVGARSSRAPTDSVSAPSPSVR
jgi:hypothetical protein